MADVKLEVNADVKQDVKQEENKEVKSDNKEEQQKAPKQFQTKHYGGVIQPSRIKSYLEDSFMEKQKFAKNILAIDFHDKKKHDDDEDDEVKSDAKKKKQLEKYQKALEEAKKAGLPEKKWPVHPDEIRADKAKRTEEKAKRAEEKAKKAEEAFQKKLAEAKAAGKPDDELPVRRDENAIRFSQKSVVALACFYDILIPRLLEYNYLNMVGAKHGRLQIQWMFAEDQMQGLPEKVFIQSLPCIISAFAHHIEVIKCKQEDKPLPEDDEDEVTLGRNFITYIKEIKKNMDFHAGDTKVSMCSDLAKLLSNIIIDSIDWFASFCVVECRSRGLKTVNARLIMEIITAHLISTGNETLAMRYLTEIKTKTDMWSKHKAEQAAALAIKMEAAKATQQTAK